MELTIPVNNRDHNRGKENAPVTLVEYGDFECPDCKYAYPIIKELQKLEGNKLRFVFRNFPLSQIHRYAFGAACAAEAAGRQGKFWEMHDLIFENQSFLEETDLLDHAKDLSMDIQLFTKDMKSKEISEEVKEDFMGGIRSGVNGTPTFFINGNKYNGLCELNFLREEIEMAARLVKKGGFTNGSV